MTLFQGLSAFPITPADEAGIVDITALSAILERIAIEGVDSVGLLGSTGTYVYLTQEQRRRAIVSSAEVLSGHVPLMVGVGALRTSDAVLLARDAEAAGANGLLLAPVSYIPLSQDEVYRHFATVAAATSLPLCIYNNPAATHFQFSDDLLSRLAQVPNISAAKMPSPAKADVPEELQRLRPLMPATFKVGYSWDRRAADAVACGGDAWYSGMGGVLPAPIMKLCRAAQAGDTADVDRMNTVFAPLWDLCTSLGTVRVIYAIANATGLFEGHPPLPISPLSQDDRKTVLKAVNLLSAV